MYTLCSFVFSIKNLHWVFGGIFILLGWLKKNTLFKICQKHKGVAFNLVGSTVFIITPNSSQIFSYYIILVLPILAISVILAILGVNFGLCCRFFTIFSTFHFQLYGEVQRITDCKQTIGSRTTRLVALERALNSAENGM